jgi:hypothetical protein
MLFRFSGKKNVRPTPEPTAKWAYVWRGKSRPDCPAVYVAIQRVHFGSLAAAVRRCKRSRNLVFANIVHKDPPLTERFYWTEVSTVWSEILPTNSRTPRRLPTHFLEVGLQNKRQEDKPERSALLSAALCFEIDGYDGFSDYCAAEVGGFLAWQLGIWTKVDFEGATLDSRPAQQWLLQCVFAKWKALRTRQLK